MILVTLGQAKDASVALTEALFLNSPRTVGVLSV